MQSSSSIGDAVLIDLQWLLIPFYLLLFFLFLFGAVICQWKEIQINDISSEKV